MPSRRLERVRELLKRALGEAIRREIPVNQAGLISVNDVEVAGDLRTAKVFVSVLGNAQQQKTAMTVLGENRVRLQGLLAKAVVLKFTPQLRFVLDDSVQRGNRVLQILEELDQPGATE
jgi:ribosome-binding factor A